MNSTHQKFFIALTLTALSALVIGAYLRAGSAPAEAVTPPTGMAVVDHDTNQVELRHAEPEPQASEALQPSSEETHAKKPQDVKTGEFLRSACPAYADLSSMDPQQSRQIGKRLDALVTDIKDQLAASALAEHQYAAAMLEENTPKRLALVAQAIAQDPYVSSYYHTALKLCQKRPDDPLCAQTEWQESLTRLDGDNSETWILIAVEEHRQGNTAEALIAVERAAATSSANAFWTERIQMMRQSMQSTGRTTAFESNLIALGIMVSSAPSYQRITGLCAAQSEVDATWAEACIRYGEQLEQVGQTSVSQAFGLSIQEIAHNHTGNEDMASAVKSRQAKLRTDGSIAASDESEILVLVGVPELFDQFLTDFVKHGEHAAIQRAHEDVSAFVRADPQKACDIVNRISLL